MRNYEERNQSGKSGRTWKRRWRIAALVLCVCVVLTAYPELPSMLSVFAAEETDEGGQETAQEQETQQEQEPAGADINPDVEESAQTTDSDYAASTDEEIDGVQTVSQEEVSGETNQELTFDGHTDTDSGTTLEESVAVQESADTKESAVIQESTAAKESTVLQESTAAEEGTVIEEGTSAARPRRAAARAAIVESGTDWTLDADGLLTITSDEGFKSLKSKHPYGWSSNTSAVTSIFIAGTVTTIPSVAFSTYYPNVTSVTISEGVQRIENAVFCKTALESVTIPQSVTEMQGMVFTECANLKSVDIQAPLTEISDRLFQDCTSLTSVTFPDSVTRIRDYAFDGCTSLQAISLPPNLEWIGWYAFRGTALERITIPEGVTNLLAHAFENTASLEEVRFLGRKPPENSNNQDMFKNCKFVNEGKKGIIVPCGSNNSIDYRNSFIFKDWTTYIQEEPHATPLAHIDAKSATCTEDGNIEYWTCSACGYYFSDAEGKNLIYTIKKNALGHNYAYTASGAVITETCQNNCGHSETAVLSVKTGADLTYTGTPLIPVTVTYSGGWAGSSDMKPAETAIAYADNTNVGTASASLTISNAAAELTFEIKPAKMTGITATGYTGVYDVAAHGITVSNVPQGAVVKYGTTDGTYTKTTSPTYTNVGTYTVYWQVTKANHETVTGAQAVVIKARTLTAADVATGAALTYNGTQQTQTVSVTAGGRTLASGTDYTVSGNTGTAAKTYTLTVAGKGNYTGTVKKEFQIAPKTLTDSMVNGVSASYTYTGGAVTPAVTVQDGGKTLTSGTDYTVTYRNNTAAGTASVEIAAKSGGNYTGTVTKQFQITPKTLTDSMVSGISASYVYTGSAVTPAVTVQDGGKTLTNGTDYTVTYQNNTAAGIASVTVAGKGNYGGTAVINFTIRYNPLPEGKTLADYVTVSPEPKDGWYSADIILDAAAGITIGETPAAAGEHIAFTQETGTQDADVTIYIKDKDGSIYETQFSYKLDKTPPVIDLSNKTVTNGRTIWDWIVGKTGMTIGIPKSDITDDLSGVAQVGYTAVDDNGVQKIGTAAQKGESYVITLAQEFSGTVKITATDYAGNSSEVSLAADGGKVVAEDTAPTITTNVSEGYYEVPTKLTITVSDDTENAITAGIATVTYQVGNEVQQSVTVDDSTLQEKVVFEIPASEIPTGVSQIKIRAQDNAGNSASKEITMKVKGPEYTPEAETDYRNEQLTGLDAGADYVINGTQTVTADENGCIPIQEEWIGTTVDIVKKGNGAETTDSTAQGISLPARPVLTPDAPKKSSCTEDSITLVAAAGVEYRIAGNADVSGEWQKGTGFTGLTEKTVYTFTARYAATDTAFASPDSDSTQIATMPKPPTQDKFAIDYIAETFLLKNGVEAFEDAGCATSVTEGSVNAYMGTTVYIRYPEKGIVPHSRPTAVEIPIRPSAPSFTAQDASYPTAQDGALTGLDTAFAYEIRKEGGEWEDAPLAGTRIDGLGSGTYEVRVKATANVCFYGEAARAVIGEQPAKPEKEPQAAINYEKEILTGLEPGGEYIINGEPVKADENGEIPIKDDWHGKTLEVVKKGDGGATMDSTAQSVILPPKPSAPATLDVKDTSYPTAQDGAVTGFDPSRKYEIRKEGGAWEDVILTRTETELGGLPAGTYEVRIKAEEGTSFPGEPVTLVIGETPATPEPKPEAKPDIEKGILTGLEPGGEYIINGEPVKADEKGEIPIKDDWYGKTLEIVKKGDGTDKSDSEPQSVTVPPKKVNTYTVTLSDGKGYTLTALTGSISPVDEGKSYTFRFALAKGYLKTKSFAVKVNGEKITLTAQDTYTIQDIKENKTVTVEGVKKKSSSGSSSGGSSGGGSGSSGGSSDSGSDSTQNPPSETPGTSPTGTPQETPNTDSSTPDADSTNPASGSPDADSTQTTVPKKDTVETKTDKPKQDVSSESEKKQTNIREGSDEVTATDSGTQPETQTNDQITQTSPEKAALVIESGAVTVTVNNVDETACTAKVTDTAAVAGAVLTQKELVTAGEGAGIEIRIDVAHMEDVPLVDAQVIEQGVEAYQDIFPDMNMGMYIDISMFMRKGSGDWNAVHTTNEPIEIVLDIPRELMSLFADFYILRAHEGAYLLLEDLDDNPETITISTDAFSTYAITYRMKNDAEKQTQGVELQDEEAQSAEYPAACSLCHICPTFLGICCFIWLAVFAVIVAVALVIFLKKKKRPEKK